MAAANYDCRQDGESRPLRPARAHEGTRKQDETLRGDRGDGRGHTASVVEGSPVLELRKGRRAAEMMRIEVRIEEHKERQNKPSSSAQRKQNTQRQSRTDHASRCTLALMHAPTGVCTCEFFIEASAMSPVIWYSVRPTRPRAAHIRADQCQREHDTDICNKQRCFSASMRSARARARKLAQRSTCCTASAAAFLPHHWFAACGRRISGPSIHHCAVM